MAASLYTSPPIRRQNGGDVYRCLSSSFLRLRIAGGVAAEDSAAEARAFVRGHVFPAGFEAAAVVGPGEAAASDAAKEDAAEGQETEGLPEGDGVPSEERRDQPVPEVADDLATEEGEEHHPCERERRDQDHSFSSCHFGFILSSVRRRCRGGVRGDGSPRGVCGTRACCRSSPAWWPSR